MAHASSLARTQLIEAEARFRLWGLSGGKMATVEADFCESPQVGEVLKRADVILVNNEVFVFPLSTLLSSRAR
jgi:H3 lysine-79-specific histone-lysine N-methyltransferase